MLIGVSSYHSTTFLPLDVPPYGMPQHLPAQATRSIMPTRNYILSTSVSYAFRHNALNRKPPKYKIKKNRNSLSANKKKKSLKPGPGQRKPL